MAQSPRIFFLKALPPGARWITVRPNGPGTEGHPLLVQPAGDGAMKVIGGAGGKLNHLKLTGVRSEADYKQETAQKQAAARERRKEQAKQDKEDGLTESKSRAREALRAAVGDHQAKFVQAVSEAMGWKPEETAFPEHLYQNLSKQAQDKAARQHANAVLQRARDAVDMQRRTLVQDAEVRSAADLGEVPLTSSKPDQLSVQDLDPVEPGGNGLGFQASYGKRAEAAGLTKEALASEVEAAKPPPSSDGKQSPGEARKEMAAKIAGELKTVQDPLPQLDMQKIVDAKKIVGLLKAKKALDVAARSARDQAKKIDASKEAIEPKAYILETAGPVDSDVVRDLENDLRTLRTRAFLDEVKSSGGPMEQLARHVGVGAYNSVNALALAAGGSSLVDRSVVDVLGIAGASQVLARRLHSDLTPDEMQTLHKAMENYHVDHYMALSDKSLREAREWHEMAHEIELGEAATGADLAAMQELNAKRREFVGNAQQVLGTALGEMEANAALVLALGQKPKDQLQASLGKTSIEDAIKQARAIGLDRGDYQIEKVGASTIMTVTGAGMDKLAKPVAKEDLIATRQALDIIEGRDDEDDWLPNGVARRPDLAMNPEPGVAPRLAKPFRVGADGVDAAIKAYIGGRAADGDSAADIMSGLLNEDTLRAAGDRGAFMDALSKIAPLYDADGKMIRAESHQGTFEKLADAFVDRLGGDAMPLHRQQFPVDQTSVDALHRALAAHPDGVAAFKAVGDLSPQDQGALRAVFAKEYGRTDGATKDLQTKLDKLSGEEPVKESQGLFGPETNPAWSSWKQERDGIAEALNKSTMTWGKYLSVMGSPASAYAAMQDVVRSNVLNTFADIHNRLRPGAPLKVGKQVIRNDLNHLDALDEGAREQRLASQRDLTDRLRNRVGGKYAAGSVSEKLDAARQAEEAQNQAQLGMFGAEEAPAAAPGEPAKPLQLGERHTIGHAAERQIAGMMPIVGKDFRPGQPVPIWQPTMSGKYVGRQRAVKLIEHDKRIMLGLGTGSGKTSISMAAFTHLKSKGKAKRGLFVVPSVVQGQFHGEALTLLEPGKFNWHCNPGADRAERIAALKNPNVDFNVVTHQSLRDDLLHLAAEKDGTTPDDVATRLAAMPDEEQAAYMRGVMDHHGINHDYMAVDEGHNLLNRAGKDNSRMANVLDGISRGMGHYVNMTADPVKNDASEAFDVLRKVAPDRYKDRDAFMRKYGVDTASSRDELKREMARHFYTGRIESGKAAHKSEIPVELSEGDHARLNAISKASAAARAARIEGWVDVEAMKTLSPNSFEGVDPAQHEATAANLQRSLGIIENTATHQAMSGEGKLDALSKVAADRRGKQGVVFAHSLQAIKDISARLQKEGHRVVTMTGADSSKDKDKKKRAFQSGEHDIMVVSDAGAVGANLQKGKWLAQHDTPQTAMLHAQRNGRIDRIGQTDDVELLDLVANHPVERRARKRLAEKYDLRDIMTSPLEGLDDRGIAGYLHRAQAGQAEAEQPHYRPAEPHEVPAGLVDDDQQSLF
jgi:superfamily II DNA or RNA helicase